MTADVGACDGLVVLELTQGMAGPMAGMILADHGATVIKVESPAGDWARQLPGFTMWNRGKKSVVLDGAQPEDAQRLKAMLRVADVVIQDNGRYWSPLGLDDPALEGDNPGLIRCIISGLGPLESKITSVRAYDGVLSALVGRMAETDRLNGAIPNQDRQWPIFTASPTSTYGAAQLAVQGILAALLDRHTSGRGAVVETSLVQAWAVFMMRHELARGAVPDWSAGGTPEFKRAIEICFMTAQCSDGKYIQMCARQPAHFRTWVQALGLGALLEEDRFRGAPLSLATVQDADDLEALIRAVMVTKSQAQWMRMFIEDVDVGADPFLTPSEFLDHPQMVENGRSIVIEDAELGTVRQVGPLVNMSRTPASITRSAPTLGEHTATTDSLVMRPERDGVHAPSDEARSLPLAGVTILEAGYYVAGPLATSLLAEMGARVIKVEPFDGDPYRKAGLQSSKFLHGKESIAIDLKSKAGLEITHRLVAMSDAVVHSFRPGVPQRLGLDYAQVIEINPNIVYLNASSYGSNGPQKHRSAFHSTPTALSGAGIFQAGQGNPPVDDTFPDPGSAVAAATALMLGLWVQRSTGIGQYLETTMLTSTGYIISNELVLHDGAPRWQIPDGGQHGLSALYRLYRCQSGWVFLAVVTDAEWRRFCAAIGRPGWLDDPTLRDAAGRRHNDGELVSEIAALFKSKSSQDWAHLLQSSRVGCVEVTNAGAESFMERHGLLTPMDHPGFGSYWRLPPKVTFAGVPPSDRPAAWLGEHTVAVLTELGYDADAIDGLIKDDVVLAWDQSSSAS